MMNMIFQNFVMVCLYIIMHDLLISLFYFYFYFYLGPDGPLDDCDEQSKCIEFEVNQITSGSSYGSGYSGYGGLTGSGYGSGSGTTTYQVCLWWDSSLKTCEKDGTVSQVCYGQDDSSLIYNGLPSISKNKENKVCKEVGCGEIAEFGVKDGKGCSNYYGSQFKKVTRGKGYNKEIFTGKCSYNDGYCGGSYSSTDDCTWEIPTPECTPEPTQPTPEPTWPTPSPTAPTSDPTSDLEPCDCYLATYEDYHEYPKPKFQYNCFKYILTRPSNTRYSPFCQQQLDFAILGTCIGAKRNLTKLISLIHGCDDYEVVDTVINGETIQGLKCVLGDWDDDQENQIISVCLDQEIIEEFGIIQQTAYQLSNGQSEICDQDGLPDICQTLDPTIDPTSDPTNDPTTDPTKWPTPAPTDIPSDSPTNDPTTIPTYNPTSDPTYYPTWYPTTDPTYNPTDSPTQPICDPVYNDEIELDVVIIADRSCRTSDNDDYCQLRQVFLAELMTRIKGEDPLKIGDDIRSRVAYFEFGYASPSIVIDLNDGDYNSGPINMPDIVDYYQEIKGRGCSQVGGTTYNSLYSVIYDAIDALDPLPDGLNTKTGTTKKIVVVSDCEETPGGTNSITDICDQDLIDDLRKKNIDVIFVNLGATDGDVSDAYGSCLATPSNVYNPEIDVPDDIYDTVDVIDDEICEENTYSPTSMDTYT